MPTFSQIRGYLNLEMPSELEGMFANHYLGPSNPTPIRGTSSSYFQNKPGFAFPPSETSDEFDSLWPEPCSSITDRMEDLLDKIKSLDIVIPNHQEVRSYLIDHEDLVEVLLIAIRACKNLFNNNTQLSLEISKDPEMDDQAMVLFVRQYQYTSDIVEILEKVDERYMDLIPETNGYFLAMTDYQPPRS